MSTVRECILDGAYIYAQLEFSTEAVNEEIQKMINEGLVKEALKASEKLFNMGLIGNRLIKQAKAFLKPEGD